MKKIRIGVIGLGWMGAVHGRNILANPKAELVGLCDADQAGARRFLKATGHRCEVYTDYRRFLKGRLDAVVVTSPNALHAEMCVAAARAHKHVYCEKPMAITLDDCRRVREAVEKAHTQYLIGYHRRFNPLYQHVKGLLDQGRLGQPFMVESDYLHHVPGHLGIWSWLGKEKIAGSLFHAGSGHNVDLIRYFCGDITEVSCMKGIFLPRMQQVETEDTAVAIFRFRNGAIGKVQCCVGPIIPFTFNFRLYGTKGTVLNNRIWFDTTPRFADAGYESDCVTLPSRWIPDNAQGGVSETWRQAMDHFIDVLAENKPCLNDVKSAFKTSAACFAAVKSAQTNRVIDIKGME